MSKKWKRFFLLAKEGLRKDVERAFAVPVSRWFLLNKPITLWGSEKAENVMKPAIILHNVIVEAMCDG